MEKDNERFQNQKELKEIIERYNLTQRQVADLIEKETKEGIGDRKLRSWLADPQLKSSRTLPNWAITALKNAIKKMNEDQKS